MVYAQWKSNPQIVPTSYSIVETDLNTGTSSTSYINGAWVYGVSRYCGGTANGWPNALSITLPAGQYIIYEKSPLF